MANERGGSGPSHSYSYYSDTDPDEEEVPKKEGGKKTSKTKHTSEHWPNATQKATTRKGN